MKRIVIIGAGIAGLSTAFFLQKKYKAALQNGGMDLTVLESASRPGGHIESVAVDGFTFEAGPRGFLGGGTHTLRMAEDAGVLDQVLVSDDSARRRYLWYSGRLHRLPTNPIGALTSPLIGVRTVATLVREYWKRNEPATSEETLAEFFARRFSKALVDDLLDPVISGIYAGNVHRLHAASIFEKLVLAEREHGSILRGMMKGDGSGKLPNPYPQFGKRTLLTFNGGLETLIKAVAKTLGERIRTGTVITGLEKSANGYTIGCRSHGVNTTLEADTVIACAPAFGTASLVRGLSPGLADDLEKIEYAPIVVVNLGYKSFRHPLNGFGFLAARNQRLAMLGSLWNSSIFPSLTPADSTSLTVMIGGACDPGIRNRPDDEILATVRKEIALTLGIQRSADITKLHRYDRGIPQYNIGYVSTIASIRRQLASWPDFHLMGNYLGGVGVNDCTKNAFEFAERF